MKAHIEDVVKVLSEEDNEELWDKWIEFQAMDNLNKTKSVPNDDDRKALKETFKAYEKCRAKIFAKEFPTINFSDQSLIWNCDFPSKTITISYN